MSTRKLWKVVYDELIWRPESKVKVYDIYVQNCRQDYVRRQDRFEAGRSIAPPGRYAEVWVDVRDGHGWQLHERIDLADENA